MARFIGLYVENFAKIRLMDIAIKRGVNLITGKNGAGKSSAIDALQVGIIGQKALPVKPLRKGAERWKVVTRTDEFTVTRTGGETGVPTLDIVMAKGKTRDDTPQKFLDRFKNALTFDPLAFMNMTTEEQVAMLRGLAGIKEELFDELNEANEKDYKERMQINKETSALKVQLDSITVLDGLPKEKLDEAAILEKLNSAGEANRKAQETFRAKQELGAHVGVKRAAFEQNERFLESQSQKIEEIERQLLLARQAEQAALGERKRLERELLEAERAHEAAPAGEPVDVGALTTELQSAQRTNRAIVERDRAKELGDLLKARTAEAAGLTRKMEDREEEKRAALAKAPLPVEGLVFDETKVLYKGMPPAALGTGERLRLSTRIGMAANPGLRLMCIDNGEALDDEGLELMDKLAEEYDFDVLITKVDSSGKIGIVMEDGMVARVNEAE